MKPTPLKRLAILAAILAGLCSSESRGIVIRHDRDDERYRVPAGRYPEVVDVGRAHGTLIAPRWVLTAAHVVDGGLSPLSGSVGISGREVPVRRIVLHPSWVGDLGPGLAEPDWVDMALIELAEPVDGVTPARPYAGSDEVGRQVSFVGAGRTGDGITGGVGEPGVLRAATNTVARADADWLYFDFDAPPGGTELEGISGPGDSGNGALLEIDGVRHILGVGSRNDFVDRALEECTYGTVEVYSRVSTQLDWIRRTIRERSKPLVLEPLRADDWPDTPAGRIARTFFSTYNAGRDESWMRFARHELSEGRRRLIAPSDWVRLWRSQRRRTGRVVPAAFAALSETKLVVLAASSEHWRSYTFELLGEKPHLVREIAPRREQSLHGRPLPDPAGFLVPEKESPDG